MEVFTQFSSDLDAGTKEMLQYGKGLMELLKQPLCQPLSMAEQVITLCAATDRVMLDVPLSEMKDFQRGMLDWFAREHSDIMSELAGKKVLGDELKKRILDAARDFKQSRKQAKRLPAKPVR